MKIASATLLLIGILNSEVNCQSNRVYVYRNCEIINGDTVNCYSTTKSKSGNWIDYEVGIKGHTDFNNSNEYKEYKSYRNLISEGKYSNDLKVGIWKYYSEYHSYEPQYIKRLVFFNLNGIKDSVEITFHKANEIESKTFWDNGTIDSIIVYYDTNHVKFCGKYFEGNLNSFKIFYPNGELKYIGNKIVNYKVTQLKHFDSMGIETTPIDYDVTKIATLEKLMDYMIWFPPVNKKCHPTPSVESF